MKKLFVSFIFQDEKLYGYIDGYTIYIDNDYAVIYVPQKGKIYSIEVSELEVIGYSTI